MYWLIMTFAFIAACFAFICTVVLFTSSEHFKGAGKGDVLRFAVQVWILAFLIAMTANTYEIMKALGG